MWMDLGSVIQNEINQKEKNKYCILTHMWNLEKWQFAVVQSLSCVANLWTAARQASLS